MRETTPGEVCSPPTPLPTLSHSLLLSLPVPLVHETRRFDGSTSPHDVEPFFFRVSCTRGRGSELGRGVGLAEAGFDSAVRFAHVLAQPASGRGVRGPGQPASGRGARGPAQLACGVKSRGLLVCFPPTAGRDGSVPRLGSAGRLLPWSYPGWSRRAGNRPRLIAEARFSGVRQAKTWVVESSSRVFCDRCPGSCRGARLPARS